MNSGLLTDLHQCFRSRLKMLQDLFLIRLQKDSEEETMSPLRKLRRKKERSRRVLL